MNTTAPPPCSLGQIAGYFLRLGALGFGGPVALVGYMHRDLVEQRGWISEADYREGLALAQIAPGPLAAQLAIYLGYVHHGLAGASAAGVAFILPSFLMVVALARAYVAYDGLPWMQAVFYGVSAAVIGLLSLSAWRLANRNLGRDTLRWGLFTGVALVTILTRSEIAWLFLASGCVVWWLRARPGAGSSTVSGVLPILPGLTLALPAMPLLLQLGLFFAKAGAFVFGSGLAIVPFLYSGTVVEHQWLNDRQFVDAVAVAMITPGPVVITSGFIGYLIAGLPGASVASLATFLPCYLITVCAAPYFKRHGRKPGLVAFVEGITAAAMGALSGAVVVLAQRSIVDLPTMLLALGTALLLNWKKSLPEPLLIALAALLGLVLYPLTRHP